MRKGWFGILLCISLIFSFSGIKGKFTENMRAEFVTLEQNSNGVVFYSQGLPENESGQVSIKGLTSRLANSNLDICDYFTLTTLSTSPRSISFPKPLKSIHSLQIHSTLHSPPIREEFGNSMFSLLLYRSFVQILYLYPQAHHHLIRPHTLNVSFPIYYSLRDNIISF